MMKIWEMRVIIFILQFHFFFLLSKIYDATKKDAVTSPHNNDMKNTE